MPILLAMALMTPGMVLVAVLVMDTARAARAVWTATARPPWVRARRARRLA